MCGGDSGYIATAPETTMIACIDLAALPAAAGPASTVTAALGVAAMPMPAAALAWGDLLAHRDALVRYAGRRLHDPMLAEDVVHDVFEAVLSGRAAFAGRSALRSWLTGILKHKIVDLVRDRARTDSLDEDDDGIGPMTALACPRARPDELAEQRQDLQRALARIEQLPATLREVVQRRLLHDQSTGEVCRALGISEENMFVRLHRARKLLS